VGAYSPNILGSIAAKLMDQREFGSPCTAGEAATRRDRLTHTWHFTAVECHCDEVNGRVFGHERRVEERAGALSHVTRHVTVVDDDLNVTAAGLARVDCTQ